MLYSQVFLPFLHSELPHARRTHSLMAGSPHFTAKEVATIDKMHKENKMPQAILAVMQRLRARRGLSGPSRSVVYRFLRGETYARGVVRLSFWGRRPGRQRAGIQKS